MIIFPLPMTEDEFRNLKKGDKVIFNSKVLDSNTTWKKDNYIPPSFDVIFQPGQIAKVDRAGPQTIDFIAVFHSSEYLFCFFKKYAADLAPMMHLHTSKLDHGKLGQLAVSGTESQHNAVDPLSNASGEVCGYCNGTGRGLLMPRCPRCS